jgi:hypothetical protein
VGDQEIAARVEQGSGDKEFRRSGVFGLNKLSWSPHILWINVP